MNTEVKHTPGPWKVDVSGINPDLTVRRFHPTYLEEENIAEVNWSRHTINENKANAKLIAAAPELLEALKIAQQYMNVFLIRGEEPLVGDSLKTDHYKVLEAIKKATV